MINSASFSVPIQFHRLDGNELLLFYIHSAIIWPIYYLLHSSQFITSFQVYVLKLLYRYFNVFYSTGRRKLEWNIQMPFGRPRQVELNDMELSCMQQNFYSTKAQNANKNESY